MRPNANRRIATRRNTPRSSWIPLSIGAGALLLPPLALGAAFYAMLAPPQVNNTADTAAVPVQAAAPDPRQQAAPVAAPATVAAAPAIAEPLPGSSAADNTQEAPARSSAVQFGGTPTAAGGAAVTPAADTPAAPKRPVHRHAPPRPQQDPFPLKSWLQEIGILAHDAPADGHRQ
jgi:hypothetical protein